MYLLIMENPQAPETGRRTPDVEMFESRGQMKIKCEGTRPTCIKLSKRVGEQDGRETVVSSRFNIGYATASTLWSSYKLDSPLLSFTSLFTFAFPVFHMPSEYISDEVPRWADMPHSHPFGLVGGQFNDLIVATPNASVLYPPMYGQLCHLLFCEDYRWGPDDYINMPQPYLQVNNHIVCSPAPTYINDHTKHLFRAFKDDNWTPLGNHGVDGLGHINPVLRRNLQSKARDTLVRVDDIFEEDQMGRLYDFDRNNLPRFRECAWALRRNLDAIAFIKTKHQVKMQYVDILRWDMELHGFIEYVRVLDVKRRLRPLAVAWG
ncbi:hypothetical protein CYLTODRAFT_483744 [Cylindrobasidium torrendii FP15055 ss-10]|uniref:Uncharacterized protein n=1 Tax=Cylindrobasidium torrendii FP15055 ss-10 TaxID=1314674 RepID=A0A0D7ARS3_9AGAR|nr:hypothetical protein CYLTODRAFT_483744 [Cylindrobasidium torrendii FP15055 ss-10]